MVKVTSLPDKIDIDVAAGETLLEAALRSRMPAAVGQNVRPTASGSSMACTQ
jgi:hypothetical protein